MPFVNAICALMMLINVGGATIFAVQIGKKDTVSANDVFRHGMLLLVGVSAVTSFCMNLVLVGMIGDIGVNAYSVLTYTSSFFFGVIFGTGEGLQPLLGQSYGAKDEKSLKFYFRSGLLISLFGSLLVTVLYILLGEPLCALFGADSVTADYTVKIIPMYSIGFVVWLLTQ